MVTITDVLPKSRAAKAGIEKNDILISINGREIRDVLDYRFYLADENISVLVKRGDKTLEFKIKKQVNLVLKQRKPAYLNSNLAKVSLYDCDKAV